MSKPRFQNLIIANSKGGVRKSGLLSALASLALLENVPFAVVEVDDQRKLIAMYPDRALQIKLPSVDTIVLDDLADVTALDPLALQLCGGNSNVLVLCEIGANFDSRFSDAAASVGLNEMIVASGRQTAILIPYTSEEDAIVGAEKTIRRMEIALPDAAIIPCRCIDGGDPKKLVSSSAQTALQRLNELKGKSGELCLSHLRPRALKFQDALALSPLAMATIDPATVSARLGMTASEVHSIKNQFQVFLGEMGEEAKRVLNFPDTMESTDVPNAEIA